MTEIDTITSILALLSLERIVFQAVAMSITALVIPGLRVTSIFGPILTVTSLAVINTHAWNAALFFHVPETLTTQAGLLILVNGAIFWLLVKLLPGIEIRGILPALAAPVVFTILTVLTEQYGKHVDWWQLLSVIVEQLGNVKEYFMTSGSPVSSAISPLPDPSPGI